MTPSERERRIKAAERVLHSFRAAGAALDAADEAVPMVSEEIVNEMVWLRREEQKRDLEQRAERAEAAARDLFRAAKDVQKTWRASALTDRMFEPMGQLAEVLARYPSFSGEEGTEG